MEVSILLADNDPVFLSNCSDFLSSYGYRVVTANTPREVRELLERKTIHLIILDLRLTDDKNENDRSGLQLAKDTTRIIPKLISTKFPVHEDVRDAMRYDGQNLPPAIDFVDKRKGLPQLLTAVQDAIRNYVNINWQLSIEWKDEIRFSLIKMIDPEIDGELLLERVGEFNDLFRRIFLDEKQIRVDQLIWHKDGRVALRVFTFKENMGQGAVLLVCGRNLVIDQEIMLVRTFHPNVPGEYGTSLINHVETMHYGACSYGFSKNNLEQVISLKNLYYTGANSSFKGALTTLFDVTLHNWHQDKVFQIQDTSIKNLFFDKLDLPVDEALSSLLSERISFLKTESPVVGVEIEHKKGMIYFQYANQKYSFTSPLNTISRAISLQNRSLLINVPGILTGENILVDDNRLGAWVTDFYKAGSAPYLWNFISIETAIRFDWSEVKEIFRLHEMENSLVNVYFDRLKVQDLEPSIRKPMRAIQAVRKIAPVISGKDILSYHQGVLFFALKRFLDFNMTSSFTYGELLRTIHLLLSIVLISSYICDNNETEGNFGSMKYPELSIDIETRTILLGDQKISLARRPFEVLQYLFENLGRICTANELRKNVLGENYSSTYIHTLVGRIREKLEIDPKEEHYLITDNVGYRLVVKPEV